MTDSTQTPESDPAADSARAQVEDLRVPVDVPFGAIAVGHIPLDQTTYMEAGVMGWAKRNFYDMSSRCIRVRIACISAENRRQSLSPAWTRETLR